MLTYPPGLHKLRQYRETRERQPLPIEGGFQIKGGIPPSSQFD